MKKRRRRNYKLVVCCGATGWKLRKTNRRREIVAGS
jgi:hypothetical protein